jgi:hypothetical protein
MLRIPEKQLEHDTITKVLNRDIRLVLQDLKKLICIYCHNDIEKPFITLDCGCVTCSPSCLEDHLQLIISKAIETDTGVIFTGKVYCLCTYNFNSVQFKKLIKVKKENNLTALDAIINKVLENYCFICLYKLGEDKHSLELFNHIEEYAETRLDTHNHCSKCRLIGSEVFCDICSETHMTYSVLSRKDCCACLII